MFPSVLGGQSCWRKQETKVLLDFESNNLRADMNLLQITEEGRKRKVDVGGSGTHEVIFLDGRLKKGS